ncbi:MAG TPA: hypothetical protein VGR38_13290 [Candidatus Polarisedimenticolia bacterium]|nr:hypothetical protein [Candidatus Polarisedimenticolia bacterium]
MKEDRKNLIPSGSASRQRKPYEAPAIVFTTKVEARAVVCSKADGNCTLGPTSS